MPKLLAAIVRRDRPITRWERRCWDNLSRSDHVRIACVGLLTNKETWTDTHHRGWYHRRVYQHIDMLGERGDQQRLDAATVDSTCAQDLARKFSSLRLDAIVSLGVSPRVLTTLAHAARFGVWRFDFDEADALAAQYESPTWHIEGTIEALLPNGERQVLHAGRLRKQRSLALTVSHVMEATAYWPEHVFAELSLTSKLPFREMSSEPVPARASRADVTRRHLQRHFVAVVEKLFLLDTWNVGRMRCSVNEILADSRPHRIEWQHPLPGARYIMNPFPVDPDAGTDVFVEEFSYGRNPKGRIASINLVSGAGLAALPAMSSPGHMAYPHTFRWGDRLLCTPEMLEAGRNGVYERTADGTWSYLTEILNGTRVVDPTIFQHNGHWWLLCSIEESFSQTQLFCFFADNPIGDWRPHPLNPVKCDIRAGRPAGAVIRFGSRLIRPAKDSARHYGSAVSLCEIVDLTTTTFEEITLARVEPDPNAPYPDGLHTINPYNGGLVVDGLKRQFHPLAIVYKAWAMQAAKRRALETAASHATA